jgi:GDSL-like Lipase/Acylhydrolase family
MNRLNTSIKIILGNLAVLTAMLLVLSITGELYLRWKHDKKYSARPSYLVVDQHTGWAPRGNLNKTYFAPDYSQEVVTDEFGHRLGARGPIKKDDALILLVGDSFTFGWGVSTSETFASFLDENLAEAHPHVRVVNLGVPGYGTLAFADKLELALSRYKHHRILAVLVFHADNDPVDNVTYALFRAGFQEPEEHGDRGPESSLRVVNYLAHLWNSVRGKSLLRATLKEGGPVEINGTLVAQYSDLDVAQETDLKKAKEQEALTPLQVQLMGLGLDKLEKLAKDRHIPLHHILLDHLAPPAYSMAMASVFENRDDAGKGIGFHGMIGQNPETNVHNAHSGGHYTNGFNRYYGEVLFQLLEESGDLIQPQRSSGSVSNDDKPGGPKQRWP